MGKIRRFTAHHHRYLFPSNHDFPPYFQHSPMSFPPPLKRNDVARPSAKHLVLFPSQRNDAVVLKTPCPDRTEPNPQNTPLGNLNDRTKRPTIEVIRLNLQSFFVTTEKSVSFKSLFESPRKS
ncbi:hypothetical protein Pyn_17640 [Prunus yedoensis var. nudiflora]|uniref:Uncharacterized protein n=1 Tax=Prunus yedoensis var. nudiflora TaxID=2094558 RepID=A0A314YUB1_PRUYE|nr:hypothetical protein Pyn_17640 [Prunus yedoensis var. nudiflora]